MTTLITALVLFIAATVGISAVWAYISRGSPMTDEELNVGQAIPPSGRPHVGQGSPGTPFGHMG